MSLRVLIRPSRGIPLLLAGAAAVVAGAALLSAPPLPRDPEPAAVPEPSPRAGGEETRSYAYYPEQLAALSSLNSFSPAADAGRPAAAPVIAVPAPHRPERAAEARRGEPSRASPRFAAPAAASPRESAPAEPADKKPDGWKVFGIALPRPGWPDGEAVSRAAANWRDAAAGLPGKALALGAGVGRLWPFAGDPQPGAKSPARAN